MQRSEDRAQRSDTHHQRLFIICLSKLCFLFSVFCFLSVSVFASEDKFKTAEEYLKTKNYIKAKEVYRDIFLSAPKGPLSEKALFGMGKADYYLKNYYEARQNIKRFISVSQIPGYRDEAYLLLGYISLHFQKFKEAEQYFEMVGVSLKEKADIGKAEAALKTGDIVKAESSLAVVSKRVMETDPRALYVRANIYSMKGMQREAVSAINRILDPVLKDHDMRIDKAQIYFNAGKFRESERLCRSIIDNPVSSIERVRAKRILLNIYEAENKVDEALKLSLELLPYESGDDFKLKIVSMYDRKGDMYNAIKYLTYLKDKRTRSAEIEKRLKSIVNLKDSKGIEYYLKFAQYLDADAPFVVDASRYLIANGKKFEGMLLLRKALKGAVKGDASLYLSELLINEGKYAEAEKILVPLTLDSRYLYKASYMIAEIMGRQGKYIPAIEYLTKIVKAAKDYFIAAKLGDLYYRTGDRQNAVKYYIMASNKGDGLSSVKAGDCLYIAGDYSKAKIYYKRALDYDVKDPKSLQWAQYQYGKLTQNGDYMKKAISGGGEIAETASVISGGKK